MIHKWLAILWIGIIFAMASCEVGKRYIRGQVEIAALECDV